MKVDGYYSEHFLTQHYMLRQLAIYRESRDAIVHRERLILDICGNTLPSWLKEQKAQPVKARLLSISTGCPHNCPLSFLHAQAHTNVSLHSPQIASCL